MKYIIEHLEKKLYNWCLLEYRHISKIIGKKNLIFTNARGEKATEKLSELGEVFNKSVADLELKYICILDPFAEKTLLQEDKSKFEFLVFGGILGDYPPQKRTKTMLLEKLKNKNIIYQTRNLGKEQMSTDTAVYVAKKIIGGTQLEKIKFKDTIIIHINENEEVELPFRYVFEDGKIVLPDGIVEFLKKRKTF